MNKHAWYGWRKDQVDPRDRVFGAWPVKTAPLPEQVLLAEHMPPVLEQGMLGSCTGHGIAVADFFAASKQGEKINDLTSRLMLYWLEREDEGTLASDCGASIRTGMKVLNKTGCCDESLWPYDITRFKDKPPAPCFENAEKHQSIEYSRIPDGDLVAMQQCLADGYCFVFGSLIYPQFESQQCAKDGIVKMPGRKELIFGAVGAHCMVCYGYYSATQMFRVRNSWGDDWGIAGDCLIPFEYMATMFVTSDLWTLRKVEM